MDELTDLLNSLVPLANAVTDLYRQYLDQLTSHIMAAMGIPAHLLGVTEAHGELERAGVPLEWSKALESDPLDTVARLAFSDWLEESGKVEIANGFRAMAALGRRPLCTKRPSPGWFFATVRDTNRFVKSWSSPRERAGDGARPPRGGMYRDRPCIIPGEWAELYKKPNGRRERTMGSVPSLAWLEYQLAVAWSFVPDEYKSRWLALVNTEAGPS